MAATVDDLALQVNTLTAQVNALLAAVNVQKSYIDAATTIAVSGITGSTGSASPAVGKSPLGNSSGLFSYAWLDPTTSVVNAASAAGTVDALTGAFTPPITSLATGLTLEVRAAGANVTTAPTFSANGLAAKVIVKGAGLPLVAGDISGAGHWLILTYDSVLDKWVIENPATGARTSAAAGPLAASGITGAAPLAGPVLTAPVVDSLNGGQLAGMRNRIINGDMRIDQRNNGAAVTHPGGGVVYYMDRFYMLCSVASKLSVQQVAAPAGFIGCAYAAKITTVGAYTPVGSEIFVFDQAIEGFNISDLGWGTANAKPVTLSFWVQASIAGQYSTEILSSGGQYTYAATFTVSAANVAQKVSITIPGLTTGTTLTNNTTGFYWVISLGCGATATTSTANAWVAGSFSQAPGCVQLVSNAAANLYISQIQIELGSVATPFEQRPIGLELSLCQRYYEQGYTRAFTYNNGAFNTAATSAGFLAQKRVVPTMSFIGTPGYGNATSVSFNTPSLSGFGADIVTSAAGTAVASFTYAASSEL